MTGLDEASAYLSRRGVLEATATEFQVQLVPTPSHDQLISWLGANGYDLEAAIVFPNLGVDQDTAQILVHSYSVRCFPPPIWSDGKERKFLATRGASYRPYILPPVLDHAFNTGEPIYIVEKQTAALLLRQNGFSAIAFDGTWGAAGKRVEGENVKLHPVLAEFDWIGRPLYLCFDSDFRARTNVLWGLIRAYILFSMAGAVVRLVQWDPALKGIEDHVAAKAGCHLAAQRTELDKLIASVSGLPADEAAGKWIIPQYRSLFEREMAVIVPGMAERSQLAECLHQALGTTASDLKKSWSLVTKPVEKETPSSPGYPIPEIYADPIDYSEGMFRILSHFNNPRFVVITNEQAIVCTIDAMSTFLTEWIDDWLHFTYVSAGAKESGKTRLLCLFYELTYWSTLMGDPTAAALYYQLKEGPHTLCIDEVDSSSDRAQAIFALVNLSTTRSTAWIPRVDMDAKKTVWFPTFCPKFLCGVDRLPDMTASRCVEIRMMKKAPGGPRVRITKTDRQEFAECRSIMMRMASEIGPSLADYDIEKLVLPVGISDRDADNWTLLFITAELIGPPWPELLARAYVVLNPPKDPDASDDSAGTKYGEALVRDLARIWVDHQDVEFYSGDYLLVQLKGMKERPWPNMNRGFGMSHEKMAELLRAFNGIKAFQHRTRDGKRLRGYFLKHLITVFERYAADIWKNPPFSPPEPEPPEPPPDKPLNSNDLDPAQVDEKEEKKDPSKQPEPQPEPDRSTSESTTKQGPAQVAQVKTPQKGICLLNAPPSTPQAGFCIATHPERFVAVDVETYYPWPSDGEITASERRRLHEGKAHKLAKDPRRNIIRLLSICIVVGVAHPAQVETRVFDLSRQPEPGVPIIYTDQVPIYYRELLQNSTLIVHNADFDLTVLRRHGFEVSSSIFDTLLAAQLLSLGEVEPKRRHLDSEEEQTALEDFEDDEATNFEQTFVPVANDLAAVVERYLGIKMEKETSKLGASDWSVPLTPEQLAYAEGDVAHSHALVGRLTEELKKHGQWSNFLERSEFLVHLNNVKFAGIPTDRAMLLADKSACEELVASTKTALREMFQDYRPLIPKSRMKKKDKKVSSPAEGIAIVDAFKDTEEMNPGYHVHIKAALAVHGIEVPDTKKHTLSAIDTPETRALCRYAEQTKLLTIIKGIEASIFPDGRVRSAQWNQLVARSGRIIPREPNVQQLPRKWRQPFRVEDPYYWLKMDLSQIEIYILAIHCQCPHLIELLQSGQDVYVLIAAEIFGRRPSRGDGPNQVSEILRDTTKTLVLGIAYCLGQRQFIKRVEIATRPSFGVQGTTYSNDEAREFYAKFFEMFPEVRTFQDQCLDQALEAQFVYTATGQRRFLPPLVQDIDEVTGYWKSRAYRQHVLVNTPIQGGAACHYIRSINKLVPRLPIGVELVHLIHDEVGLLVTEATAKATINAVRVSFQEAFAEIFGQQLTAKLEPQISDSWAKIPKS